MPNINISLFIFSISSGAIPTNNNPSSQKRNCPNCQPYFGLDPFYFHCCGIFNLAYCDFYQGNSNNRQNNARLALIPFFLFALCERLPFVIPYMSFFCKPTLGLMRTAYNRFWNIYVGLIGTYTVTINVLFSF